ncbi:MAG: GLUG motif-containing protein [Thermoplasmata archaeon]
MKDMNRTRIYAGTLVLLLLISLFSVGVTLSTETPDEDILQTQITDWYGLDDIRNDMSANYELMNDLDQDTLGYDDVAGPGANGGVGWQPIGSFNSEFTGNFNGQGFIIRSLYIDRSGQDTGLFGAISGSTLENMILEDVDITSDQDFTGGLVGWSGNAPSTIRNSSVNGSITGANRVGGLVGQIQESTVVTNSHTTGEVNGNNYVGGLVGRCGFAGESPGYIHESYSEAVVGGENYVGGLVGSNEGDASNPGTIENCYATGTVDGNTYVGGLIGENNQGPLGGWRGEVYNSYAAAPVSGSSSVGGLVGNNGNDYDCFWDIDVSGTTDSAGGTGLSTAEMMNYDNFNGAGWDIAVVAEWTGEIWYIDDGNDYPRLGEPDMIPTAETREATDVTNAEATLHGELISIGQEEAVDVFFRYREDGAATWTETTAQNMGALGNFEQYISSLVSITTYEFKAVVQWNGEENIGDTLTFTTDPGEVENVSIEPSPTAEVEAGVDLQFTAAAYDGDGNLITDTASDFNWDGADSNGVFNRIGIGDYQVTAAYQGVTSEPTTVTVLPTSVDAVNIYPAGTATVFEGEDLEFTGEAWDQYFNLITDDPTDFTWSGADANGVFNEDVPGEYEVTATYQGVTSEPTTVTVEEKPTDTPFFRVNIIDYSQEVIEGGVVTVEYTVENEGEETGTQDIVFSVEGVEEEVYADLTLNVDEEYTGTFTWTAGVEGTYTLEVSSEDSSDSVSVTVTEDPGTVVDYIVISPEDESIYAGNTVTYTATAYDEFDDEIGDVTHETTWSIETGAGGSWSDNVYTAENTGEWVVTGTYEGHSDTATLTVTDPEPIEYIVISPEDETIYAGNTVTYAATAYDESHDVVEDVTGDTVWSIETGAGGSWSDNVYTAENAGEWIVTGTYEGHSDNAALTVVDAEPIEYIVISPDETTITAGAEQAYTAAAYDDSDNEIDDVTQHTDWTINPGAGGDWDGNVYTAELTGTWTVTGTYQHGEEELTAEATLTVEPGETAVVTISPSGTINVSPGEEVVFTAAAYDDHDNLITDGVAAFEWQNAEDGVFNQETEGDYEVTASYQGITSHVTTVTVEITGAARFEFFNLRASPREIQFGRMQEFKLSVDVENVGEESGECNLDFYVEMPDGRSMLIGSASEYIEAGETRTVTLTHYEDSIGKYNITMGKMVLPVEVIERSEDGRNLGTILGFFIALIVIITIIFLFFAKRGKEEETEITPIDEPQIEPTEEVKESGSDIIEEAFEKTEKEKTEGGGPTIIFECPVCGAGVGEEDTHCPRCNAIFEEDEVDVKETDKEDDIFDPEGMDEDDLDAELGLR